MAKNSGRADDLLPARIETGGDVGTACEQFPQAEPDVRLRQLLFEREAFLDLRPRIGESPCIQQHDAFAGDAKIL